MHLQRSPRHALSSQWHCTALWARCGRCGSLPQRRVLRHDCPVANDTMPRFNRRETAIVLFSNRVCWAEIKMVSIFWSQRPTVTFCLAIVLCFGWLSFYCFCGPVNSCIVSVNVLSTRNNNVLRIQREENRISWFYRKFNCDSGLSSATEISQLFRRPAMDRLKLMKNTALIIFYLDYNLE